jgi:hypothetical protein
METEECEANEVSASPAKLGEEHWKDIPTLQAMSIIRRQT